MPDINIVYGALVRRPELQSDLVEIPHGHHWWYEFDWTGALLLLLACVCGATSITLLVIAMKAL